MKVSIVIPVYNEEGNLEVIISKMVEVLEEYEETYDYELVIVNDNSTDWTQEIIDNLASKNARIKPVHRHSNPGFGNAVKDGFRNASGDIIVTMAGNKTDDPHDIPRLVRKIEEGYDVVYGSRFIEGGAVEGYPQARMFANRTFNNCVRLFFGMQHKDITNFFKAYRKEVIDDIGDDLEASGFDITVELPLKAHIMGFTGAEVPVTWRQGYDEEFKERSTLKYAKHLLKLFFTGNVISLKDLLGSVASGSKLKLLAALAFGIIVLLGIFSVSDYSKVYETLKNISLFYVLLGFAAISVAYIIRTWRWSVLLRTSGYTAPNVILFNSLMFGFLLNLLLPARVGDIARGAALKATEKTPMGISLTTIVIERAMDMFTLALLLGAGTMFLSKSTTVFAFVISLAIALLLVILLFIAYRYDTFISKKLEKRIPAVQGFMNSMKEGLKRMYHNPGALVLSIAISLPVWILEISGTYMAAMAIKYHIPFSLAAVAGIMSFISQTIPVTIAGIGIYDGTMAGVFTIFGVPYSTGLSLTLVDHYFIRTPVVIIFGAISTIHLGFASRVYFRRHKRFQKVATSF